MPIAASTKPQSRGVGIYKTHTEPFLLRFSPDLRKRVEKAARDAGKSMSDFCRDAIVKHIDAETERKREASERQAADAERAFVPRGASPRGFRPRLREAAPPAAPPPPVAAAPTIVVNAAAAVPTGPASADVLAAYVAGASNIIETEERRRAVEKIIRAAGAQEEIEKLAAAVDAKLAEIKPQPAKSPWERLMSGITTGTRR